jgi:hypothetical protein
VAVLETHHERAVERSLSDQIRMAALAELDARAITEQELAQLLGVSEAAVFLLSLKERWPLAVSIQVAEKLGLHIEMKISNKTNEMASGARAA